MFGNSEAIHTDLTAKVGPFSSVLVPEGLAEDLVSPNPFLDAGFQVHMTGKEGEIFNPSTGERIPIWREGKRWCIQLADVENVTHQETSPTTLSYATTANLSDTPMAPMDPIVPISPISPVALSTPNAPSTAHIDPIPPTTSSAASPIAPNATQAAGFMDVLHALNASTIGEGADFITTGTRLRVTELHHRMGHASVEAMCHAVSGSKPTWRNSGLTASQIRRAMRNNPCPHCLLAKRNKPPIPKSSKSHGPVQSGEIICADPVGKISPATAEGYQYFFLFEDVATGFLHALPSKSKDLFPDALQHVLSWYKARGCVPKILRTDSEELVTSAAVETILAEAHMSAEQSAPYAHYQNGAERHVQTDSV